MDHQITRQILWNVPVVFQIFMYGMFFVLMGALFYEGWRWYRMISLGQPVNRFDQPRRRFLLSMRDAVGQGNVIRESWGWTHYAFYVGFLGLVIGTTIVFINDEIADFFGLFGLHYYFFYGDFYLVFKAAMDTFFMLLAVAIVVAATRRGVTRPRELNGPPPPKMMANLENRLGYWFPLLMLVIVPITGLMLEGARINAHPGGFVEWAYLGRNVAKIEGALGAGVMFHRWLWLTHVILVYMLLFCLPFTKLRHFLFAPVNLYFRNLGPRGRLAPITDFENAETFGVSQVEQYNWKQLLDMSSCLECGRCTINCPTVNTNKTLNPKYVVIEQREHLLSRAPGLIAARATAAKSADGAVVPEPPAGLDMIADIVTEQAIWGCTTCGWCEEGCPVGIEHIQRFIDMRRHLTLMESKFPQQAGNAFRGIEVQGNPWGLDQAKRADWAAGLDIPTMAEVEDPASLDVLYWVGCAGSYDERNQRVSRSFSGLMKQAGVKFGILGTEELCTGDPARRLGNEYLYATVAGQNVETLNRYKPRVIVTQCPHCFHNLKNEYPDFGLETVEVIHEAEFIDELIKAGRLKPKKALDQRVTYHDPCYMARHNRKWDGARSALGAIPGTKLTDVHQCKNRTFCCGAGGGCFWKEEREGSRINQARFDQISEANPETLAVGCPFCMTQMEDAMKTKGMEEQMRVRDLSELVAESTGALDIK